MAIPYLLLGHRYPAQMSRLTGKLRDGEASHAVVPKAFPSYSPATQVSHELRAPRRLSMVCLQESAFCIWIRFFAAIPTLSSTSRPCSFLMNP